MGLRYHVKGTRTLDYRDWEVIESIGIGFDWFGGIEKLGVLQVMSGLHSSRHESSILTSPDCLFNTFLHRPAQPGHVVLVDQPRVWRDKLRQQFGILIIRLGGATKSKSSWTEYASGRCRAVWIFHRNGHVSF